MTLAATHSEPDDDGKRKVVGPRPGAPASEFRGSLLLVLGVDLVALLTWLAWSRRASSLAGLVVAATIVPLALVLALRPRVRRPATLLIRRERRRAAVFVPVAASVVLSSLALGVGHDARHLPVESAVYHLGPIDEVIVSPDANARNQALDAITRARENDPRVATGIDDLLPLVAVDALLAIGAQQVPVTAVELDVPVAAGFGKQPSETGLTGLPPLLVGDVAVGPNLIANLGPGPVPVRLSIGGQGIDVRARALPSGRGFGSLDLDGLGRPRLGATAATPVVYVAPGTVATAIDKMSDGGAAVNARFLVAVSNLGDARRGLRRSAAVTTLLEEVLAQPPTGPTSIPADDPLGLGGTVASVPGAINASVVAVKSAHVARIAGEFAETELARRVARGALFAAAGVVLLAAYLARRRMHGDRVRVLRAFGLRGRTGAALRAALVLSGVVVGLPLGVIAAVGAAMAVGRISQLPSAFPAPLSTVAQAVALPASVVLLAMVAAGVGVVVPSGIRSWLRGLALVRPSVVIVAPVGLALVAVGMALGRQATELRIGAAVVLTVLGLAMALGPTFLPRRPFGARTAARPTRRSRTRSFAGVCVATGLAVLPVAASQRLPAAAASGSNWRSVAQINNESDAVGLLRQLVAPTGGRVLRRADVLVADELARRSDAPAELRELSPAIPAVAVTAGDGQGDGWAPRSFGQPSVADLEPGSIIVSRRFAALRPGPLAIGDNLVLVDPVTTRSVRVSVADIVSFPGWAGDVAVPIDVFSGLRTDALTAVARSALAVSVSSPAAARVAMAALSPTAAVQITSVDARPDATVADAFGRWLRRSALIMVSMFLATALSLRTSHWRHVRWTVVLIAAVAGLTLGLAFGGARTMNPIGPLAWALGVGSLCAFCGLRVVAPEARVRNVAKALPSLPLPSGRDRGEFD